MAFGLDLGNLLVHLRADSLQFERTLLSAEQRLTATANKLNAMGRTMTMRVTAPLIAIAAGATKSFASFDDAMTKSLAIMKDVTPELREEMEKVATDISKKSVTSATNLAKSYFYLASAGLSAEQSIAALGAVEKFAVAGAFDMALATDLVTDAQSALGMTVKDAQKNLKNMTRVTDVLIGANTLANASAQQFSEALMRAGPAMKAYGIEIEEGTAVLAAYADQGKKAAEGGELFGRMLRLMIKGFIDNREAWDRFSISIERADGRLRPIADIVRDLTNLLEGMGVIQKSTTLMMLGFQARSQQTILPLLGLGDAIELYNELLLDMAGITQRIADKQLKSFSSQMKIMWHNVTDVARDIGSMLAPSILKLNEHVVNATEFWHSLNDSVKQNVLLYAALAAAIGPVLIATGMLLKTFAFMITAVKTLVGVFVGLTAAIAAPIVPVLALIAIAYVFRAAWNQNVKAVRDMMQDFVLTCKELFEYLANTVVGKFVVYTYNAFKELFVIIGKGWKEFVADVAAGTAAAGAFVAGLWKGPEAALEAWASTYAETYKTVLGKMVSFEEFTVKTFETTALTLRAFGEAIVESLENLMDAVKTQFGEDADALIVLIKNKIESLKTPMDELREASEEVFGKEMMGAETARAVGAVKEEVKKVVAATKEAETAAAELADAYRSVYSQMGKMTEDVYKAKMAALDDLKAEYKSFGMDVKVLTKWYEEQVEVLEIEYLQAIGDVVGGFKAAGMQIRREMTTWGERAYEFSMEFRDAFADGLETSLRDADNWKEHMLNMLEEVYWAALRIAFIEPAAAGLAGAFATGAGALLGSGGQTWSQFKTAGPGSASFQHGGLVEKTGWAVVHEGETYSGVDKSASDKSPIEVNVNYTGQERHEIDVEQSVGAMKQTILTVTMEAMQTEPKYRRSIKQAARA